MEHHRCAHCRNPIRRGEVSVPGDLEVLWFHPDCWAVAQSANQKAYLTQVEAKGIEALFAPYALKAQAATMVTDIVVAQASPPDLEGIMVDTPQRPDGPDSA
jgi:hypothetical protein